MKKAILFLVALLAMSACVFAQGQTATLQQGDKMTPFYGPDAFVQAYNAAQKGAVITLSAGTFNTVDSITKQVTIIGNGYRDDKTVLKTLDPGSVSLRVYEANNVKLEGLDLGNVVIRNTNHLTIRRCRIDGVNRLVIVQFEEYKVKNTIVDQCIIGFFSPSGVENCCIKNSIVSAFHESPYFPATNLLICNCLFAMKNGSNAVPHAVYKNCLIGTAFLDNENEIYDYSMESGREFYNNVFFGGFFDWQVKIDRDIESSVISYSLNENTRWTTPELNWTESQTCKGNTAVSYGAVFGESDDENPLLAPIITTIQGDDGTVVGPYGGTGFSINPGIPRIVESKIDSYTDAEGKLNVKVKVEVNQ